VFFRPFDWQLEYSTVRNSCDKSASRSTAQEVPCVLWNSKVHCPVFRNSIAESVLPLLLWRDSELNAWPIIRLNRLTFFVVFCSPRVRWRRKGGTGLLLHSFLTSALSGGKKLASSPCHFAVGKEPGTHWIGGWMGSRASLEVLERRKMSLLCRDTNPDRPARSLDYQYFLRHFSSLFTSLTYRLTPYKLNLSCWQRN